MSTKIMDTCVIRKSIPHKTGLYDDDTTKKDASSGIGLSSYANLPARFFLKVFLNSEFQCFSSDLAGKKIPPKKSYVRQGRIIQNGLTRHAKKTLRLVCTGFHFLTSDKSFRERYILCDNPYNTYSRFITLSYRQFIPEDSEAKHLLNVFLKRCRRLTKSNGEGHSFRYAWVAEIQEKRLKKRKERAIHFHIVTPDKIYTDSHTDNSNFVRLQENLWINRAWNEIVSDYAKKKKLITSRQYDEWRHELSKNEKYNKLLYDYRYGSRTKEPRKPSRSKYLLLPNCIHVNDITRYMTKYISKSGHKIGGNMWSVDTQSREFTKPISITSIPLPYSLAGNDISAYIYKRLKSDGEMCYVNETYEECFSVWGTDGWKALEYYYDYMETNKENIGKL